MYPLGIFAPLTFEPPKMNAFPQMTARNLSRFELLHGFA